MAIGDGMSRVRLDKVGLSGGRFLSGSGVVHVVMAAFEAGRREAQHRDDRARLGYVPPMDSDRLEAIQNVVDRVSSYQDGATEDTVERELRSGLDEAGIELEDQQVRALASAIDANAGEVTVSDVLE